MTGNNTKSDLSARTESKSAPISHSNFDLSYHHFMTPSYGRVTPFLKLEGVSGDDLTIRNNSKIRSYTLKSPLMSDVYMQKDYFAVPMECILPQNWNKIFTNPVVGDDVDATSCNCVIDLSLYDFSTLPNLILSSLKKGPGYFPHLSLNALFFLERFFSKGSLFSLNGINVWSSLTFKSFQLVDDQNGYRYDSPQYADVDDFIDCVLGYFRHLILDRDPASVTINYLELDSSLNEGYSTKTIVFAPSYQGDTSYVEDLFDFCREHFISSIVIPNMDTTPMSYTIGSIQYNPINSYLNISSIAAYQIVCAHYFTNDRIDYIYSAELYRQMMRSFCTDYSTHHFSYNGVDTLYDELSGHWLEVMMGSIQFNEPSLAQLKAYYYFVNLLGFNNSLRFSDYFTGARLTPLAVGNTDISVNANVVSVIDVTRNIQIQRFLNLVNKTGRKIEEYGSKLFGTYVKPDFHNPSYLGKVRDKVVSYETENTADAQQTKSVSVTSSFNQTSSNFAFEFHCDRPCIIIGVCSFDIPRVYSRIIERDALHYDRFDYFNPFMQFIGDQEVKRCEINPAIGASGEEPWGYQSRYAEYKTRVPICSGGFSKQNVLPSWQFVADMNMNSDISNNISPSYIRSRRSELDKFYLRLTGESPATRFHFIVDMHNNIQAKRNMVANPNIL